MSVLFLMGISAHPYELALVIIAIVAFEFVAAVIAAAAVVVASASAIVLVVKFVTKK